MKFFNFRVDYKRRPLADYGVYRPECPVASKLYAAICLRVFNGSANGEFRVSFNSQSDIRFPVNLSELFQSDDLRGFQATVILKPDELVFEESLYLDF